MHVVFNCFLRAFILVLVILFSFLEILAQVGLWLSPINCKFVIQLSWLHNGSVRTPTHVFKSSFIIFHPPQKKTSTSIDENKF